MYNIQLSDQDVQDLSNILDIAVRAGGLKITKQVVNIADKIQKSMDEKEKTKVNVEVSK